MIMKYDTKVVKQEETKTILIIIKRVNYPLAIVEEKRIKIILIEQMKRCMINLMINIIIVINMIIFKSV